MGRVVDGRVTVRVRSEVGAAAAFWCGGPTGVGREHHVEWTVEEDVSWGGNTRPAASFLSGVDEKEGDRIVFRGRLGLTGDGGATLEVAGTHILSTSPTRRHRLLSMERGSRSAWSGTVSACGPTCCD
ncbi:hypothetical protein GCM10010342_19090 [Streptomyces anulatus]|nr:hypothetical protein GCM10010342_19090 [Streptomyces anulatus]